MQLVSLRQIKSRIRGIENIGKITNVMELISAAKLKNVENSLKASRNYLAKLESLLNNLCGNAGVGGHPLLLAREKIKNIILCVFTSDTGLCSSYNNNILHAAEDFINAKGPDSVELVIIGKKGCGYFKKRGRCLLNTFTELRGTYSEPLCRQLVGQLAEAFLSKNADAVYMAYTHFHSSSRHIPTIKKLLDIEYKKSEELDYLLEPDLAGVLNRLIPEYLFTKTRVIFQEALTSEHAARVMAMSQANDNAEELLDSLLLLRNKVRQAGITRDIMEIVSSAEALKR